MLTEKEIETGILDYLRDVPNSFFWKNQSVGIFDPKKRVFRKNRNPHAINGVSDILGLLAGRMIAIEVKKPKPSKSYPSKDQKDFIAKVNSVGGAACVARSIEDVQEFLEIICGEEENGLL